METTAAELATAASADEALIARAQRGDAGAFSALVAGRVDRCYRLAWSILANDADAADATQDACVTAWRQLPRLRDRGAFDSWLNRIVATTSLMARRHRVRLREVAVTPAPDEPWSGFQEPPYDPYAKTDIDELHDSDELGRVFRRLQPRERAILVLHHLEGRPVAELARTLSIPVGTAKWRLHAARRALERAMEAEA